MSNPETFVENKQTEFNSSLACLIRLDGLLTDCNKFSRLSISPELNPEFLNLWFHTLKAVYREISSYVIKGENKSDDKKYKTIIKLYQPKEKPELCKLYRHVGEPKNKRIIIKKNVFMYRYETCEHIEIELRELAMKYGMLMTQKDKDEGSEAEW